MKDQSRINTIAILVLLMLLLIFSFSACTKTMYIPVESVKTEYKDRIFRDSVYHSDSVFVKLKGDTVFFEKYKYLYRDKLVRDSIFKTDSIRVPYPVQVEKEVNKLSGIQSFQVWCGRIFLVLLVLWIRKKVI